MSNQKFIRKEKRALRKDINKQNRKDYSLDICNKIISTEYYKNAKKIAVYLCIPEEVNVSKIITTAWNDGKEVFLPIVIKKGTSLLFAPYFPERKLIKDILDIDIPDSSKDNYITAKQLDMVVTPLVAFDAQLNRIGMGGGFYDRTFSFKSQDSNGIKLIGAAFELQKVSENIDVNRWDIKPDLIVTEKNIYY